MELKRVSGVNEVQGHCLTVDFDYACIVVSVRRDPSEDEYMALCGDDAMAHSRELVGSDGVVKGPDDVYLLLHVIKMIFGSYICQFEKSLC